MNVSGDSVREPRGDTEVRHDQPHRRHARTRREPRAVRQRPRGAALRDRLRERALALPEAYEDHPWGETPPIPASSITKPPSAELRPGQVDSDSLPDYELLDDILDDYVEQDRGSGELLASGFDQELVEKVLRMTDHAEYKRRQYPPGPKISYKAFGRDRRLPITNRWREHAPRP